MQPTHAGLLIGTKRRVELVTGGDASKVGWIPDVLERLCEPVSRGYSGPLLGSLIADAVAGHFCSRKKAHGISKAHAGIGDGLFRRAELFQKLRKFVAIDFHPASVNIVQAAPACEEF